MNGIAELFADYNGRARRVCNSLRVRGVLRGREKEEVLQGRWNLRGFSNKFSRGRRRRGCCNHGSSSNTPYSRRLGRAARFPRITLERPITVLSVLSARRLPRFNGNNRSIPHDFVPRTRVGGGGEGNCRGDSIPTPRARMAM